MNRIKSNGNGLIVSGQSSSLQEQSNLPKRSNTIESIVSSSSNKNSDAFLSSLKNENTLKSRKFLNFTINTLIYILWESLFFPN